MQFYLLDALNSILPDELCWRPAIHGPEQDLGSRFHADARWWGEERDAAPPVQISAAHLDLPRSQSRGTRIARVQLISFVVQISCMAR